MTSSKAVTNFIKIDIPDKLSEWVGDTDFDDYMEYKFGELHYKIIIDLLLLLQIYNNCDNLLLHIRQNKEDVSYKYLQECINTYNVADCLIVHLQNIETLYALINERKTYINYNNNTNQYLELFRGFSYNRYEYFFNIIHHKFGMITPGVIITTPTFLSTSIYKDVAFRFMSKSTIPDLQHTNIIWKIIVPGNKFHIFNYIYFGESSSTKNKKDFNDEAEILLNISAMLRCISIKDENKNNCNYKVYTFEFIGWDDNYMMTLNNSIKSLIECLESMS